jgi:uncharacterized protein YidB (DUF937 family)
MSFLNDAINAALHDHNVPQLGAAGSSSLADALRSLLAPKATNAGLPPDDTHLEPDALSEILTRLDHAGYGDAVRSWISVGKNEPIEPAHIDASLGPHVADLSRTCGLRRETLH